MNTSRPMKVVFTNRSDCMTHRGGDTTQMLLTKKYLEANHPVEVSLCFNPTELKSKKADLVHVFNTQTFRESRAFLDIAKEMGWKTALSTIYWNMDYSIAAYGLFLLSLKKPRRIFRAISHPLVKLTSLLPGTRYLSAKYRNEIRYLLDHSDIILPNSDEEMNLMRDHFLPFETRLVRVVPNAIEIPEGTMLNEVKHEENLVLQVGRICVSKNQAGTLHALMDKPEIRILIIGTVDDPSYDRYLHQLAEQRGNVEFIREIPYEELVSYYKRAAVHVLPSFRDSTGLVSLEALYFGCEIVVSEPDFVPSRYYRFDEIGYTCNPFDINSIRVAIERAFRIRKNTRDVRQSYFDFFNYRTVAKLTYEAYQEVLTGNGDHQR